MMGGIGKKIFSDAEAGNPYARLGLAYSFHQGKDVEPDPNLAIRWYIMSAEAGCSRAKWELAKIFRDGTIAEADSRTYMLYLKAAAEAGVPEAKMEYGIHHLNGEQIEKDETLAFQWIFSAAGQGLPMAQFMTGYMLGKGIGVEQDTSEQEVWYARAGLTGDAEMFYQIGRSFEYGLFNIGINMFEAGRWYKSGADMGHEKCTICWMAVLEALSGHGHDSLEEREWKLMQTEVEMEKAARDQILTVADGFLDAGDDESAFLSYQEAAELGNSTAIFTLALMYHEGIFVKRSDRTALELMSKASLAGSKDAQFMMGNLYEEGKWVDKNKKEAIRYYTMAASNGHLLAYYRLSLYIEHPEIYVRNARSIVR